MADTLALAQANLLSPVVLFFALGLLAALIVFGRDGKMAGYGLMLATGSLGLWWAGLRGARP